MSTVQEREVLKEFIEVYRDNVCLWDMSSELYRNKGMKHAAWGLLTETLKRLDPHANLSTTKKKVENLRAVYFRELKKVRQSQLTATDEGDVFVPNLWYFKLISFLDSQDWGPCRTISDPLLPTECESVKLAPESDEESMESAEHEPEILEPGIPKRKWLNRDSQSASRKIKRKIEQSSYVQTFVEPLHFQEPLKVHQVVKNKMTNSFGVYVGEQLEQIPTYQRHVAEKLISEVIFLAKTGNLNYDSKIETPSKLVNVHGYSRCQSPEYNIILSSPRKVEVEASENEHSEESEGRPRTLLKELLIEAKQKQ